MYPGLDEIKPSTKKQEDGCGGGGGGGSEARRREGRKVVPRARWQPSASRVQGRTSLLRARFPSSVNDV